jgi:hypothetical protein
MENGKQSIYSAIVKFQNDVPILTQNTEGYGYTYVDLAEIIRVITPLLKKHGLGVIQPLETDGIKTILFHEKSGESIESFCAIPKDVQLRGMNPFQSYGSAITYYRRYSLSSMLGLVSEKDTDASGKHETPKKKLSDAHFKRALESIERGDYTSTELKNTYSLTNDQLKQL